MATPKTSLGDSVVEVDGETPTQTSSVVQLGVDRAYDVMRGLASLFPTGAGVLETARAGNCRGGNSFSFLPSEVLQLGPFL